MKSFKELVPVFFRGMGMGAADVVPGVSGGTIAFITGIYEELINSLKSIDLKAIQLLFSGKIKDFWTHINGNFLIAVFGGIAVSVLSLVRVIHYLLDNHPILIWSFFFGLIIASAIMVGLKIKNKNLISLITLLVGAGIAYWITTATPGETPEDLWFIFLSGSLAICAMILPGISGSFILLLMRKYAYVTGAIKDMDFLIIGVFMAGCFIGLVTFAKLLGFLFKKYHDGTVALMTGFMLGSLQVVWPWKHVIEYRTDSHGEEVPFRYESVSPLNFEGEPQLWAAIGLALVGFVLIILLERLGGKKEA